MEKYSRWWLDVFSENYFQGAAAQSLDYLRNHRKVKLSNIDIDKRKFNYWKSEGLFNQLMMNSQTGGWLMFNSVDEISLLIIGRLWDFGFDISVIKPVLNFFYSNTLIKADLELFLQKNNEIKLADFFDPEQPKLLSFFIQEKQAHQYFINNLEFIMLYISQKSNNVSLVFDTDKNMILMIDDTIFNLEGKETPNFNFGGTFLNISVSEIISNVLIKSKESGHREFIKMFQNTNIKPDKNYIEKELPIDINISAALKEYDNQDILIEVRNKRKYKIKRTIISPKKQHL
jgi:hypothetical protein